MENVQIAHYGTTATGLGWFKAPPENTMRLGLQLVSTVMESLRPEATGFLIQGELLAVGTMESSPAQGRNETRQVTLYQFTDTNQQLNSAVIPIIDQWIVGNKQLLLQPLASMEQDIAFAQSIINGFPRTLRDDISIGKLPEQPAIDWVTMLVASQVRGNRYQPIDMSIQHRSQYALWLSRSPQVDIAGIEVHSIGQLESFSAVMLGTASVQQQTLFLCESGLGLLKIQKNLCAEAILEALGSVTSIDRVVQLLRLLPEDEWACCPLSEVTINALRQQVDKGKSLCHLKSITSSYRLLEKQLTVFPESLDKILRQIEPDTVSHHSLCVIGRVLIKDSHLFPISMLKCLRTKLQEVPQGVLEEFIDCMGEAILADIANACLRERRNGWFGRWR